MSQQDEINEINLLRKKINLLDDELSELKNLLKTKIKERQDKCPHEQFRAEDNGDYHSPGYYYNCTECGYWTNRKPDKKILYR